jgi:glycosyltransferase involved in cell wall biosynthesis
LLQSIKNRIEVIVVEDGSTITSKETVDNYSDRLNINYFLQENSGPGIARNFGMQKASGDYFIILDSDCILPIQYLEEVDTALSTKFTDAFGGADASHKSFSIIQKAINYSMTSILTTGGIRGNKNLKDKFQPRSFNMGISKVAFEKTNGFSTQRFGEDIELTFRLWENGFESQFIEKAFVYHKRRTNWQSFYKQTNNFGAARPILNTMYSNTARVTYWFPSLFVIGLLVSILFLVFKRFELLYLYGFYYSCIFLHSLFVNRSIPIAVASIFATTIQFFGYGFGFLRSFFRVSVLQKPIKEAFPRMFS